MESFKKLIIRIAASTPVDQQLLLDPDIVRDSNAAPCLNVIRKICSGKWAKRNVQKDPDACEYKGLDLSQNPGSFAKKEGAALVFSSNATASSVKIIRYSFRALALSERAPV